MKYLLFLLVFGSQQISAKPDAIYGEDNRIDPYATSNSLLLKMASSTAAMISKDNLQVNGNTTTIIGKSLGDMYKLCPTERFRQQPVAANCSGTLVAPDLIMTAGHCYELIKADCRNYSWVFDYRVSQEKQPSVTVPNSKVYRCQTVLLREVDEDARIDHALVKLDRPVTDREFAKIRATDSIKVGAEVVLVGHPTGLPTKIAPGGFVLQVNDTNFVTNLDAFSINSGSGVFNAKTGEIEGILVSGRSDYNGHGNCSTLVKYDMKDGLERVSKPIKIQSIIKNIK